MSEQQVQRKMSAKSKQTKNPIVEETVKKTERSWGVRATRKKSFTKIGHAFCCLSFLTPICLFDCDHHQTAIPVLMVFLMISAFNCFLWKIKDRPNRNHHRSCHCRSPRGAIWHFQKWHCLVHHLPPPPSLSDEIDLSTDGLAPSNSTLGNFLHQVLWFIRMICWQPQGSDLVKGCRDSSIILIEFKNLVLKYQRVTVHLPPNW